MRNFVNIGMTVTAFDFSVNAVAINYLIDIVIPALAVSIDSATISVFVAHETVVFIRSAGLGRGEQKEPYYRRKQQYADTSFICLQNAVAHVSQFSCVWPELL
jgi:putative flippase GtrA